MRPAMLATARLESGLCRELVWSEKQRHSPDPPTMTDDPVRDEPREPAEALAALAGSYSAVLAELAHALRGPLASMRTAADLLRGGLVSAADVEALTELFSNETTRTAALLTRCDGFRMLDALRPERCDLRDVVRERVEARAAEFGSRGVALALDESPEAVVTQVDREAMRALLDALLQNALDATAKREPGAARVEVSLSRGPGSGEAEVRVRDDGEGLTEGAARNAFRLFYSSRAKEGAAGVGLSLARVIARAHGGGVELHAREPRGAESVLRLPLARER